MTEVRGDYLTRFKPQPGALASKPISVFLTKEDDKIVRSLPNRSEWLRRVISEAAQRELMPQMEVES